MYAMSEILFHCPVYRLKSIAVHLRVLDAVLFRVFFRHLQVSELIWTVVYYPLTELLALYRVDINAESPDYSVLIFHCFVLLRSGIAAAPD